MIRGILFDLGGTLDGDGLHWLDRFVALYAGAGLTMPRNRLRAAFDEAERLAALDDQIASAGLDDMIERHVGWQLAHLGATADAGLHRQLVHGFVTPIRDVAATNVRVLADLAGRGFRLGVVSNGCGNVGALCADLGYAPYLSTIIDSRRVGLYKPDPAIFIHAAAMLELRPSAVMMVGDSFDRDIRPAKRVGMTTGWLEGGGARACPEPALVDMRLRRLAELPAAIDMRASA